MSPPDEINPFGIESEALGGRERQQSSRAVLRKLSGQSNRVALNELSRSLLVDGAWLFDQGILAAGIAAQLAVALTRGVESDWGKGLPVPGWMADSESARNEWLAAQADHALKGLLREDREAFDAGLAQPDEQEPRHLYLVNFLGIEKGEVLGAAVRFNELQPEVRKAFFGIYLEQRDWSELAKSKPAQYERMNSLAAKAMKAILGATGKSMTGENPNGHTPGSKDQS